MHRALAIPEIVRTILDCFSPKPEHHRKANKDYYLTATALRSSVVNVALVCRSFSEPALDILWWAMDDLTPLFNLLPGFQNEQEIHFPISAHALEVFDRFASRIRFYCIRNTAADRVSINSYVQVLQTLGRFYLLPRLQFFYTEHNEPQLLFFGSPYLCAFRAKKSLTRNANVDHIQSFLDLLPRTSPKTLELHIRFPLRKRSLHAIRQMPELQILVMDTENVDSRLSLDADFLTNLSSRQTLTKWFLAGNIGVAPLPASGFPILDFDSLRYLSFVSKKETSIAEYTPLLCAGNFPSLERMEVCLTVGHTPGQSLSPTKIWRDFFKHLRSATTDSLFAIDIMIKGPTACQVSFEDIPDLQLFPLESFETNLFHSLSAYNLWMMTTCWPGLVGLYISGVDKINCKTFPSIDDVPVLQHDLEILKLSPVYLENHIALARCIDRIFPNLVVLIISGSPPFLKSGVGKETQEIYEGLQSARKDQKKRDNVSIST